ncbi:hypothetical protein IAU59_006292 [Kwoniella sp. CBS 9459]
MSDQSTYDAMDVDMADASTNTQTHQSSAASGHQQSTHYASSQAGTSTQAGSARSTTTTAGTAASATTTDGPIAVDEDPEDTNHEDFMAKFKKEREDRMATGDRVYKPHRARRRSSSNYSTSQPSGIRKKSDKGK